MLFCFDGLSIYKLNNIFSPVRNPSLSLSGLTLCSNDLEVSITLFFYQRVVNTHHIKTAVAVCDNLANTDVSVCGSVAVLCKKSSKMLQDHSLKVRKTCDTCEKCHIFHLVYYSFPVSIPVIHVIPAVFCDILKKV